MRIHPTEHFTERYEQLPQQLQKKIDKALRFLLRDLHHPSLRAKKYDEARDIWQARVDEKYRLYFLIKKDTYILLNIKPHE